MSTWHLATPTGALDSLLSATPTAMATALGAIGAVPVSVHELGTDPYLEVLPRFAYSMPAQLAVLGVTLTLLAVLLIHLVFTVRYHYPLSKLNYIFQIIAVSLSLASTAAMLGLLIVRLDAKSKQWPYMFDYIEVEIPAPDWSQSMSVTWTIFQVFVTFSVHLTHIQFLTLLFPSPLEGRLILILLGPLALASSLLYFASLSSYDVAVDLGDAVRDTANSTLTLLYTSAFLIWGLTLNRSRAWRTDGGTAAFGVLAILFGVIGTIINFLEVREERLNWLGSVVNCILLWQSWVGFWWWIGSGMFSGEAGDIRKKISKREKRQAAKEAREAAVNGTPTGRSSNVVGEVVGSGIQAIRRRLTMNRTRSVGAISHHESDIELTTIAPASTTIAPLPAELPTTSQSAPPVSAAFRRVQSSASAGVLDPSTAPSTTSTPPPPTNPISRFIMSFMSKLSVAHDQATLENAARPQALTEDQREGWGIKAMGQRGERERGERRRAYAGGAVEEAGTTRADGGAVDDGWVDEDVAGQSAKPDKRNSGRASNLNEALGEGGSRWKTATNRWRLKDVSTY